MDPYRTQVDVPPLPPVEPLTDEEFKSAMYSIPSDHLGPVYLNPMTVARIRKLFSPSLSFPTTPRGALVGTMFGIELWWTPYIPEGWFYAPPGGHPQVLRRAPADPQYLHQFDLTAGPYIPPTPLPSRYDILMADDG